MRAHFEILLNESRIDNLAHILGSSISAKKILGFLNLRRFQNNRLIDNTSLVIEAVYGLERSLIFRVISL
jgi:hypothetical protein